MNTLTKTETELIQLIRIFEILEDRSGRDIVNKLYEILRIDTFRGNEKGQKLAITYLTGKLDTQAAPIF